MTNSAVELIERHPNEGPEVGELILRHASDYLFEQDENSLAVDVLDGLRRLLTPYAF